MNTSPPEFLDHDGVRLAYRRASASPAHADPHHASVARSEVVWLGGFHSDMLGEKATLLHHAVAEIVVTDHDNKPAFDEAWATWMPANQGPVRSFVQSVMPEGDLIEIIVTAAL